jgi:hypothetical protein
MRRVSIALMIALVITVCVAGKEKKAKPWTEWSEKDAQKMLDDSPWGQTQVETDTSEMYWTPTTSSSASRAKRGALNQATPANFRIRFLSAKPIRQAFARSIELQQKMPSNQLSDSLRSFVERKFDQWIVVAVTYDSRDQRFSGDAMQAFNSAVTSTLKNGTYLETKDGKKNFLQEYKPPINDGLGAKFIFPRTVEGQPFVTPESGEVRFYCQFVQSVTLNMRFKIADMMYDGILEY